MGVFKNISSIVLWILLLGAVVTGFIYFTSRNTGSADSRTVLPGSTALLFEFTDFPVLVSELRNNNKMWKELSTSGILEKTSISLSSLDSILKKDASLREFFKSRFSISVSLKANNSPGILFYLPKSVRKQEKQLLNILANVLKDFSYAKRRFEGSIIFDLGWKDSSGSHTFSFTTLKGVLIGSFASELVEESIRQFNPDKNITHTPEFSSVNRTLGSRVPVNVFINYQKFAGIAKYYMNPSNSLNASGLQNFAAWGGLDAEIFSDKLILNGFSSSDDSLNQELKIFLRQEPVEFHFPAFLPEDISFFKAYGFSDKDLYFKNLRLFIRGNPDSEQLNRRKSDLLKNFNIDLDKGFEEMISDEYGLAGIQAGRTTAPFFFMELKSQSLAELQFMEWMKIWAKNNNRDIKEYILDSKIDNNNTLKVFKLPIGNIPSMVFGPGFTSPENDYFTFINNYLVFANSFNSLKDFIYKVILGNTLASASAYSSLGENISSRSNLTIFAKPAPIVESGDQLFSEQGKSFIRKGKESFSMFNAISIQFSAADDLIYNHIFINYTGVFSGSVNTVWKSRIDTTTVFKPAIVLNHLTGEKEIFIQDQNNQVYLLSNAGIILWKQMLDGPVKSEIFQVDCFKNGKLQFLFNTRDKIYLLDRNGNPVEKFPVGLRSPATAGISVFDYDKDGTIRICVPGEDRKIYMYDKDGKILSGWQAGRTDNEVVHPVQHFRVGSKDYIVAIDKYKFYILDRKGNSRVQAKKYFQVSKKNSFYLDVSRGNSLARIVTTDTSGSIIRVYFSGKVEKILERKIDSRHFFVFSDIDGDQKGEFLTSYGKTFQVLSPGLEESFKIEFNDSISYRPVVYKFSASDNKIGIVLKNPGNIYLYNNNGSVYNGFPLEGAAQFSISSFPELSGRFNMIVGTKENFLYNYSVK